MMRTLFVFTCVACLLAATTPAAHDAEVVELAALAGPVPTTNPVEIEVEPEPTPTPTRPPERPEERIFTPSRPMAPIPVEQEPAPPPATPEPMPEPTPEPTPEEPEPTAPSGDEDDGTSIHVIEGTHEGGSSSPSPSPSPTPAPTSSPGQTYTKEEVRQAIRDVWQGDVDKAIRVANCESSLNPRAYNPAGPYYGLWQFHMQTWQAYGGQGDPRDRSPTYQTQVAWRLFQDRGWAPWPWCGQNT